jgi:putative transposase
MKTVAEVIGTARSNLIERLESDRSNGPQAPDSDLVTAIKVVITDLPTSGYPRMHAILKRRTLVEGR